MFYGCRMHVLVLLFDNCCLCPLVNTFKFLVFRFNISSPVNQIDYLNSTDRNSRIRDKLQQSSPMETSSLQNFTHVCGISEQMKQNFTETRTTDNARNSLAWDSAFFTSPGFLEPEELFQALNSKKCSSSFRIFGKEEENLLSAQNLEPEKWRESGNFSYRKSLAWDNAFFSEEGVLNPEELSIVNRGFNKHVKQLPPGINEKLWRSTESSLTTGSEGSSLTRLEMDLFEDIRRSVPKRSSSSKICTSSLKLGRGAALNNMDVRSKTKAKAVPSSRRQNTTTYASLRESHFPQPTKWKHDAGIGEHHKPSTLKPPRAERAKNISTPSTKRSPDGHDIKSNNKTRKAAPAQHLKGSKKPCFRDPYNPIFSSMPLLKGCLSASLVEVPESTLRSPRCMPSKSPSVTSGKSSNKIKTRDAARVTFGTPLKNTRAKKMEVEVACEPPLLSTPKSSSSLSPASSMGKWSSHSSSASATKSYTSHKTILAKQCGKVLMELDLGSRPDRGTFAGHGNLRTQHDKKCMTRHDSPLDLSKQNRPSCLRMPSPSIGYFNTENLQFETIEGESDIRSPVYPRHHRPMKHQCQKGGEKSLAMVERESYTSQKAAPDTSESFSFSDRILKEEKTLSNKEGKKDYSVQRKVKSGNSRYTGQTLASTAKAGGDGEIISRKIKRESKEHTIGEGNKENMGNFEDSVENLVRYVRVLDLSH